MTFDEWWETSVKPFDGFGDDKFAKAINTAARKISEGTFNAALEIGRVAGLREAAGIASQHAAKAESVGQEHEHNTPGRDRMFARAREALGIEAAILAAIPSPPNIGEGEQDTCESCNGPIGDVLFYEDANICRKCHEEIKMVESAHQFALGVVLDALIEIDGETTTYEDTFYRFRDWLVARAGKPIKTKE